MCVFTLQSFWEVGRVGYQSEAGKRYCTLAPVSTMDPRSCRGRDIFLAVYCVFMAFHILKMSSWFALTLTSSKFDLTVPVDNRSTFARLEQSLDHSTMHEADISGQTFSLNTRQYSYHMDPTALTREPLIPILTIPLPGNIHQPRSALPLPPRPSFRWKSPALLHSPVTVDKGGLAASS